MVSDLILRRFNTFGEFGQTGFGSGILPRGRVTLANELTFPVKNGLCWHKCVLCVTSGTPLWQPGTVYDKRIVVFVTNASPHSPHGDIILDVNWRLRASGWCTINKNLSVPSQGSPMGTLGRIHDIPVPGAICSSPGTGEREYDFQI